MLCSALRSGSVPIRRKDMQVGAHPHRGSCRQSSFAEPVPRTCWAPQQHCKPVTTLRTPSYVSSRLHTHRWKQGSASTSRMASDSAAQHASEASKGTVLIVGAGPVGLTTAIILAERGYTVQLYEKRENKDQEYKTTPPRSYFYGLSARGVGALEAAGVAVPQQKGERFGGLAKGGSMLGLAPVRQSDGTYTAKRSPTMLPSHVWVERAILVQHLAKEAKRLHSGRIHQHYQHSLQSIDFRAQRATFAGPEGTSETAYDLLVGADGRHSEVVKQLQRFDPSFSTFQRPSPLGMVGFGGIPATEDLGGPSEFFDAEGLHLHAWTGVKPRWNVVASLSSHGTISGIFTGPLESMGAVSSQQDFEQALADYVPHVPASLRLQIAESAAGAAVSDQGASGRVSTLVGPRTVLLGDAAHPVLPTMGQGCNSGLQDAALLGQALEADDLDAALQQYNRQRHPEVLALHKLDITARARAGFQGRLHPYAMASRFDSWLQACLAKLWGPPKGQSPIMAALFGSASYSAAWADWEAKRNRFFAVVAAVAALAVAGSLRMATAFA